MDECQRAFTAHPAMAVGELLQVMRVEPPPYRDRALAPGVAEQPLQHTVERLIERRDLQHLVDLAATGVINEPAEEPVALTDRTRPQPAVAGLACRLVQHPGERVAVI